MKKSLLFSLLVVVLCLLVPPQSSAQRGNLQPPVQEVIASGTSTHMSDGNVTISGTIGQAIIGVSVENNSAITHGFWHPIQKTATVAGDVVVDNTTQLSNTPNPFTEGTTIRYQLSEQSHAQLRIYDPTGHQVKVLVNEVQSEGSYQVFWDSKDQSGKEMATGYYIYKLQADPVDSQYLTLQQQGTMLLVQ